MLIESTKREKTQLPYSFVPVSLIRRVIDRSQSVTIKEIEGVGHNLLIDNPFKVANLITAFQLSDFDS